MSQANDIMTPDPAFVRPDTPVHEALRMLHDLDVRHLPVVSHDSDEVVGMVSDRDLRGLFSYDLDSESFASSLAATLSGTVSDVMSADIVTLLPQATMREIIATLLDQRVGAIPVVESDNTLVGIISYIDVLKYLEDVEE